MFTGIVEGVGKVVSFEEKKAAWLLKLQAPEFIAETLSDGDSLACNGCCLTLLGATQASCRLNFWRKP